MKMVVVGFAKVKRSTYNISVGVDSISTLSIHNKHQGKNGFYPYNQTPMGVMNTALLGLPPAKPLHTNYPVYHVNPV